MNLLLADAPGPRRPRDPRPRHRGRDPGGAGDEDPGPAELPAGQFVAESLVVAFTLPAVQAPGG